MKRRIFFLAMLILVCMQIISQEISDLYRNKLTPVSPTQYHFTKFGETPITEYRGSATIQIPIYNIETRGYSLPVKLQYNSKGIRVDEESDWVGLGWDLSFGSIIQNVNDDNDLDNNGLTKYTIPYMCCSLFGTYTYNQTKAPDFVDMSIDKESQEVGNDHTYSFVKFQEKGSYNGWDVLRYIPFDNASNYDFEKDLFTINLMGDQLNVVMKNFTGSALSNSIEFKVLNKKGYRVFVYNANLNKPVWVIINPSGVKFCFDEINKCSNSFSTAYNGGGLAIGSASSYIWQISKIIDNYGDTIHFNYTNPRKVISTNTTDSRKVGVFKRTLQGNYFLGGSGWEYSSFCGPFKNIPSYVVDDTIHTWSGTSIRREEQRTFLTSIEYNKNKLKFYTSDRIDWENTLKLDSVLISNQQNQIIRKIKMNYDYFKSNPSLVHSLTENINPLINRLKLMAVINQKDKYEFTYNTTQLPPKDSYAQDYWGYYNGQINNLSKLPNIKDFKNVSYNKKLEYLITEDCGIMYADNEYCKAGILERIKYPTGGYSIFCFSLNTFSDFEVPISPKYKTSGVYYGNGLKVDSVLNYGSDDKLLTLKFYHYEYGKMLTPLKNFLSETEEYAEIGSGSCGSGPCYPVDYYSGYILNIYSSSQYSSGAIGESSAVGYGKVTTWVVDPNSKKNAHGKTVHYYVNNPDIISSVTMGELIPLVQTYHKGLNNGTLIREEIYDDTNRLKYATNFNYEISNNNGNIEYNSKHQSLGYWIENGGHVKKTVQIAYYPLYKTETILYKKDMVSYFGVDSVVVSENYNYNDNNIITTKSITTSNSSQGYYESYLYPNDIYNNPNYSSSQRSIMSRLLSQNRLDEKIRLEHWGVTKGMGMPKIQYIEYENNTLLPAVIKTGIDNSTLQTDISLKYNSRRNIIESTGKDNVTTTYLWGYNQQYIIGIIKNATYSQVSAALGLDPETLASSSYPDISKIDALRIKMPTSQITTFNYRPLVGILSVTDIRGIVTVYAYDPLNRLKLQRDISNNILNHYEYAYLNSNEENDFNGNGTLSGTILKDGATYFKALNTATVSTTGGSGNIRYNWYLLNNSGAILQSNENGSTEFCFTPAVIGSLTLKCVMIDYYDNTTITITKPISCTYQPLSANILTVDESFYSVASTGMAAASTYKAKLQYNGGSYGSSYCVWSFINSYGTILQTVTGGPEFNFICTQKGIMTIRCLLVDNPCGCRITVNKTITVK